MSVKPAGEAVIRAAADKGSRSIQVMPPSVKRRSAPLRSNEPTQRPRAGPTVRSRRPARGAPPQPRRAYSGKTRTGVPCVHSFHRRLCTLTATQARPLPASRKSHSTASDLLRRIQYFEPHKVVSPSPPPPRRPPRVTPPSPLCPPDRHPGPHTPTAVLSTTLRAPVRGATVGSTSRTGSIPKTAKPLFPIFNRKGGLCGYRVPGFYTFYTGVDTSVDNWTKLPAYSRSSAQRNVRASRDFSR